MKIQLFRAFIQKAPNRVFFSTLFGALSGTSYALLIPVVLVSLDQGTKVLPTIDSSPHTLFDFEISNYPFAQLFFGLCLFTLLAKTISEIILTRIGLDLRTDIRLQISKMISAAPISSIENMGSAKLVATLTTDVPRIIGGALTFPGLVVNTVKLFGMLAFLVYLNQDVFIFVVKCIAFGVLTYQIPVFFARRYIDRSREHFDQLHHAFEGIIRGAKELKLDPLKRDTFYSEIVEKCEKNILKTEKKGYTVMQSTVNYGDLVNLFVIGAVSFIFVNYHSISHRDLIGVIMALLYLTNPVANILAAIPSLTIAHVSLRKVNKIFLTLEQEQVDTVKPIFEQWQVMKLRNMSYVYEGDGTGFKIGPINIDIRRGETTFIVGGNGSGKSTLSKIISHHYLPSEGTIYFDDIEINNSTLSSARSRIFAIFSDYYLFDRILFNDCDSLKNQINEYLIALELDEKVNFDNGRFSTLKLSDGQRRRLALLIAFVEDKDCYIFDEWAADQDPIFKEIFYCKILKNLKQKGKAVVVITHDDRYFHIADQMIAMENGKVINREQTSVNNNVVKDTVFQSSTITEDELIS